MPERVVDADRGRRDPPDCFLPSTAANMNSRNRGDEVSDGVAKKRVASESSLATFTGHQTNFVRPGVGLAGTGFLPQAYSFGCKSCFDSMISFQVTRLPV